MYETRADLITRLGKVDAALDMVRSSQEWRDGRMSVSRGPYASLLSERKEIIDKINLIDSQTAGGNWNRAKFTNPS